MGRKLAEAFHPGHHLHDELTARKWSQMQAARKSGIPVGRMSELLSGKRDITSRHAVGLESAGLGSAEFWMRLQAQYDLWLYRTLEEAKKPV